MKKTTALALCLLLAAGATTTPLAAQSAPRSTATIQVTLVEVPVNVYDRTGNSIRGLTAADFELTDDGKKREITNFEAIDLAKVAADPTTPAPAAARRNFMLLFDLTNSTPTNLGRSREAALDFVKKELATGDVAAVATYTVEKGFRLLTNFTTDRDALVAAVTTLGNPQFFKSTDPLMLAATMTGNGMQQALMDSARGGDDKSPVGGSAARDLEFIAAVTEGNEASARADDDFRRGRINQQIKAFANIGRILDSVSGRKQIILLSEGFDARLVQGREASGSSQQSMEEADKILSGASYEVQNDERFGNTAAANMVSTMGELLKRSDVVMHAIDIKGLRSASDPAGRKGSSNEGLYVLTRPTGGEVFKNANDLSTSFQALLKQQEVVYIIGFQAPSNTPGKFHNLKVRVKTPGAKASYRSGYYEANPNVSPLEATFTAGEILLNDVGFDAVKTSVMASAFPVKGQNPQVPVIVEIDGKSLVAGAKGQAVNADLFVYAFDRENKIRDFLFQRFGLDLTKVGEALQKGGLKFYGTLSLPPGDYAIKTLVRIPDAAMDGFKRANITVPDFSQPTVLQPVATEAPGAWLMMRGAPRPGQNFTYPYAVATDTFVPTGTWMVTQAAPQRLALFTYNVDPKDLSITGKLKAADGNTRDASLAFAKITVPDAAKAAQVFLELKTAGLAPGRYTLDLAVQPKAGGWSKSFTIPVYVQ
jgi:VWFA-related protein